MKRCPYCGSEIKEEAILCRYCRRDLPGDRPPVPTPGEQPLAYSHSGHRYVLGWTEGTFAIWDRTSPERPVLSSPRTSHGWEEAWNRFMGMEPAAVQVPLTERPSARADSKHYWISPRMPGAVTVTIIVGSLFLMLSAVLESAFSIARSHTLFGWAHAIDDASLAVALSGIALSAMILGGIAWVIWQHRVHGDLRSIDGEKLRFKPSWSIWPWLVPVASLVLPPVILGDLLRHVAAADGGGWVDRRWRLVLAGWWATLVASLALFFTVGASDAREQPTQHQLALHAWANIGADVLFIVAGILAIVLVVGLTRRIERLGRETGVARPTPLLVAEGAF